MAGSQNFRLFDEIVIKIEIGNTIFHLIFHIVNYMGINPVRQIWDTYFQFSCDTLQGSDSILHARENKSRAANLEHLFPVFV